MPQRANANSDNDLITSSVIAWSFYPKLLTRDGRGWRNVANNQSISLHPSSVNKGHHELNWLSYYHIMQAKQYVNISNPLMSLWEFSVLIHHNRFYNAHETTGAEDFAIALLCGDVKIDVSPFNFLSASFHPVYQLPAPSPQSQTDRVSALCRRARPRWQPCALRRLGLEDDASDQDTASEAAGDFDTKFSHARQGAYCSAG